MKSRKSRIHGPELKQLRASFWNLSDEDFQAAIDSSTSISSLARKLCPEGTALHAQIKQRFHSSKWDLTSWELAKAGKGSYAAARSTQSLRERTLKKVLEYEVTLFCNPSTFPPSAACGTIQAYNRIRGWLEYRCQMCGNKGSWLGQEMTLEVDHADGNPKNALLTNLRFLCPNCHSMAPTYRGRNSKRVRERRINSGVLTSLDLMQLYPNPDGFSEEVKKKALELVRSGLRNQRRASDLFEVCEYPACFPNRISCFTWLEAGGEIHGG